MKKIALAMVLALAGFAAFAVEPVAAPAQPASAATASEAVSDNWTFFQFCIAPGFPADAETVPVCGVKVGAPISCGSAPVYGVDCGVFYAGTQKVSGLQACVLVSDCDELSGLQFGIINLAKEVKGVQLGVFNSATGKSFQVGIINYIEGALIPVFPVVNFKF